MTSHWLPPFEMDDVLGDGWAARPSPALAAAHAELEAKASATATVTITDIASLYAKHPAYLEFIDDGLSKRTPRYIRCRIAVLIGEETTREFGPRPARMIHLKAAMVYAERLLDIERERKAAK